MGSVREATFEVARQHGMTTWFGNPGSTEIPLLADLPGDVRYVLALHENAAVGTAAGYAIASDRPAMVSLHTTAGLGNAVNALATARVNRAPLVVVVGQQDRRHLLAEPFLAALLGQADSPVLVTGAGAASAGAWEALTRLAALLDCPVFQEPFTARAGFPQDNPRFAGFLPAGRAALRAVLAPYDTVVVVGAAMLRQYQYEPGPLFEPGTRTAVISEDIAEVRRSPVDFGLVAPLAAAVPALAGAVTPAPR